MKGGTAMNDYELKSSAIGAEHWVENNGIELYVWEKYQGTLSSKPVFESANANGGGYYEHRCI